MSFKTNDCQQLSLDDSFMTLTECERKALEKSWAKIFADEIFSAIDEEHFSVLSSDKASRPNAPVNVIIGALIIKELFDYSDDEIVENLMLDLHFQYALHTTSFAEQPISDKTLSRMELIYTCISKLIVYLTKTRPDIVSEQLKYYADPNDYNHIFYHQRNDDMKQIIKTLLTDSECLLALCKTDFEEVTEYQLFVRSLSEQTVVENVKRRLRAKEDGTMNSSSLQKPSDPDATYRNKSVKLYRGYSANIRKNYHLDKLTRGKQRGKFFFGLQDSSLKFQKALWISKGLGELCTTSDISLIISQK